MYLTSSLRISGAHTTRGGHMWVGPTLALQLQRDWQTGHMISVETHCLDFLEGKCMWESEFVDLDGSTPTAFDAEYYKNLEKKMGTLYTDQTFVHLISLVAIYCLIHKCPIKKFTFKGGVRNPLKSSVLWFFPYSFVSDYNILHAY
ncbi:hypothetical protein SLE2022_163660 [Rubroshorea leprosula]